MSRRRNLPWPYEAPRAAEDGRVPPFAEGALAALRRGDVPGFVAETCWARSLLARDVSQEEARRLGGPPTTLAPPPPLPPHTLPPTTPALRPAGPGGNVRTWSRLHRAVC